MRNSKKLSRDMMECHVALVPGCSHSWLLACSPHTLFGDSFTWNSRSPKDSPKSVVSVLRLQHLRLHLNTRMLLTESRA